jgi:exodeoxyribonuclease-5
MTEQVWSPQQVGAQVRVSAWLKTQDQPAFLLGGYAGTGKTTLAKHMAANVDGDVYFAAFTGKAALVLKQSGCPNASTLHKLMYQPKERSNARLLQMQRELSALLRTGADTRELARRIKAETENLNRPYFAINPESPLYKAKLLVVDEYSMVDVRMGQDLMHFGCPILALGDPGQLPPVFGDSFWAREPDVMLTEIHRQAADNPILWLSREVREGRPLRSGQYGSSVVLPVGSSREDVRAQVQSSDQILVGMNATRANVNARMRQLREHTGPWPRAGEKLVCLKNNHDLGLLNGQLWKTVEDAELQPGTVSLRIENDEGDPMVVDAHQAPFVGKKVEYHQRRNGEEFDYGYALTVHKSQGSQWKKVAVMDEWKRDNRRQWLYTAVTRAQESVAVVSC